MVTRLGELAVNENPDSGSPVSDVVRAALIETGYDYWLRSEKLKRLKDVSRTCRSL
jgi:hypothetical protein